MWGCSRLIHGTESKENPRAMGFIFYANYLRLILEGGFSLMLLQRARTMMQARNEAVRASRERNDS